MKNLPKTSISAHWRRSLEITFVTLLIWSICCFGVSILFRDWFDENFTAVGNAAFGFWMAQQGGIVVFIGLLVAYAKLMAHLDEKHK